VSRLVVQLTESSSAVDARVAYGEVEAAHGQSLIAADEFAAMTGVWKALNAPGYSPDDFWPDESEALRSRGHLVQTPDGPSFSPRLTQNVGVELFRWLFPGATMSSYYEAQREQRTIDIELRFDPDTRLVGALPWELVHDGRDFVIAGRRGTLTRHLMFSGFAPACQELAIQRLRVLLIRSRPKGVPALDDSEIEAIRAVPGVEVELMTPPSLKHLADYTDGRKPVPHVIHFDGHGVYGKRCGNCGHISGRRSERCETCHLARLEPDPQGYLAWDDGEGELDMVSATDLANALGDLTGDPNSPFRIVVLSACNSATVTGSQSAFDGLAQRLIREAVPAVVGMQFPIRSDAAAEFAGRFYSNLVVGRSLAECVQRARNGLRVESGQWYRPVVYLRNRVSGPRDAEIDGKFFRFVEPAVKSQVDPPPPAAEQTVVQPAPLHAAALVKTINGAMRALASMIETDDGPAAQVRPMRSMFAELHRQLDLLGDYKDIHDQLHELKLMVYSPLLADFSGDGEPDARTLSGIDNYDRILARILVNLRGYAERGNVPPTDIGWLDELDRARLDLRQGFLHADASFVRFALDRITPVIEPEPTRINTRMEDIVRSLQLRTLSSVLEAAAGAASAGSVARSGQRLSTGVTALTTIAGTLGQLVEQHTRWQNLDIRLPLAREQLVRGRRRDFAYSWPRLQTELVALTSGGSDEWSITILAICQKLDDALRLGDSSDAIANLFQECVTGVDQRFFGLDNELKEFCGDLRELGGGLDALVDAIQELAGVTA
jgi:hypothetical protein